MLSPFLMAQPQLNPCFLAGHAAGFSFLPLTAQITLLIVLPAKRSFRLTQLAARQAVHLELIDRQDYILKLKSDTAAKMIKLLQCYSLSSLRIECGYCACSL